MKQKWVQLICKYGTGLCALAMAIAIAPLVSENCRMKYYQPKEPEGFAEFASSCKQRH